MVSSSYLTRKPAAPSGLKQFFDRRILPAAIDGAACVDMGIAGAGRQLRRNPVLSLVLALGAGAFFAVAFRPRRDA
jgi:hypothetical protein